MEINLSHLWLRTLSWTTAILSYNVSLFRKRVTIRLVEAINNSKVPSTPPAPKPPIEVDLFRHLKQSFKGSDSKVTHIRRTLIVERMGFSNSQSNQPDTASHKMCARRRSYRGAWTLRVVVNWTALGLTKTLMSRWWGTERWCDHQPPALLTCSSPSETSLNRCRAATLWMDLLTRANSAIRIESHLRS